MSAETARILREAADLLETNGWCQGAFAIGKRRCATGAINAVVASGEEALRAHRVVSRYVGAPLVSTWNDHPGRTSQEVMAALRAAADEQEVAP